VVIILHEASPASTAAITAVAQAYCKQFQQESVLVTRETVEADFIGPN